MADHMVTFGRCTPLKKLANASVMIVGPHREQADPRVDDLQRLNLRRVVDQLENARQQRIEHQPQQAIKPADIHRLPGVNPGIAIAPASGRLRHEGAVDAHRCHTGDDESPQRDLRRQDRCLGNIRPHRQPADHEEIGQVHQHARAQRDDHGHGHGDHPAQLLAALLALSQSGHMVSSMGQGNPPEARPRNMLSGKTSGTDRSRAAARPTRQIGMIRRT
jgi:hypothetical protein